MSQQVKTQSPSPNNRNSKRPDGPTLSVMVQKARLLDDVIHALRNNPGSQTDVLVARAKAELDPLVTEIADAIGMSPDLRKALPEAFQACTLTELDRDAVRALNAVARARILGTDDAVFIAALLDIANYACSICDNKELASRQKRLLYLIGIDPGVADSSAWCSESLDVTTAEVATGNAVGFAATPDDLRPKVCWMIVEALTSFHRNHGVEAVRRAAALIQERLSSTKPVVRSISKTNGKSRNLYARLRAVQ